MMIQDDIRVLLVDDDVEDANVAIIALRKVCSPTFEIVHVDNLVSAIKEIEAGTFDVLLLDLGLRECSGLAALARVREADCEIPIVVLSGLSDEDIALSSLDQGAQDYLSKDDFSPSSLSRSIRYAIQRHQSFVEIQKLLTRVQEREELLQKKNRRLAKLYETAHQFVDNISHEFRTPLTVIKEYVSLVRDQTVRPINDEQRRFLNIADDRADDLNTMVDDMLDVSKMEAGLFSVYRKNCRVASIADHVLPGLKRKCTVKGLTLDVDIDRNLPEVYCDDEKLGRVIINLAINAIKFTRAPGAVRIWAKVQRDSEDRDSEDIVIGITDDGPGIDQSRLQCIFERFKQLDTDIRSSTKGFGLGLNIAKELVDLNFGQMHVESELGEGSTFSFTVPLAHPAEVVRRYLAALEYKRNGSSVVSMVIARIDGSVEEPLTKDVNHFLNYLLRRNDLLIRVDPCRWMLLLPEYETELSHFVARTEEEFENTNRNRPHGPLPKIHIESAGTWRQLSDCSEEILSCVREQFKSREALHV